MRNEGLKMMIVSALFAAIIGALAQLTININPVPITGQTFAIGLVATILGRKYGTLSVVIYCLIGLIGAPVFSGMSSGVSVLFGPTGGYIVGFIPTVFIMGWYLETFGFTTVNSIIANLIGMLITLAFGTVWLKFAAGITWTGAFTGGFAPFILVGILKGVAAAVFGIIVRNRLVSAKLLSQTA